MQSIVIREVATSLSCTVLAALAAPVAHAEPTEGRWQGTSWGFELRAGAGLRSQDTALSPAPLIGLGVRVCTLLTLIDAELYGQTEGFTRRSGPLPTDTDAIIAGEVYDLRRTSIGFDLRLHPLFVRHLQGGFGDRVAAGLHLALGAGADILSVSGGHEAFGTALDRTDVAFAFGVGAGVDVPLTEPNDRPWSLWLDLGWRLRFTGFGESAPGLRDMDEHVIVLQLGVRFHDLTGVRVPVPPELDDADR